MFFLVCVGADLAGDVVGCELTITTVFDGVSTGSTMEIWVKSPQIMVNPHKVAWFHHLKKHHFLGHKNHQKSHARQIEELVDFFYSLSLTRTLPDHLFKVRQALDFSRSSGLEDPFLTDVLENERI